MAKNAFRYSGSHILIFLSGNRLTIIPLKFVRKRSLYQAK